MIHLDSTHTVPMDTALAEIAAIAVELRRQTIPVDLAFGGYDLNLDRARYALYSLRSIHATIKET